MLPETKQTIVRHLKGIIKAIEKEEEKRLEKVTNLLNVYPKDAPYIPDKDIWFSKIAKKRN